MPGARENRAAPLTVACALRGTSAILRCHVRRRSCEMAAPVAPEVSRCNPPAGVADPSAPRTELSPCVRAFDARFRCAAARADRTNERRLRPAPPLGGAGRAPAPLKISKRSTLGTRATAARHRCVSRAFVASRRASRRFSISSLLYFFIAEIAPKGSLASACSTTRSSVRGHRVARAAVDRRGAVGREGESAPVRGGPGGSAGGCRGGDRDGNVEHGRIRVSETRLASVLGPLEEPSLTCIGVSCV